MFIHSIISLLSKCYHIKIGFNKIWNMELEFEFNWPQLDVEFKFE